MNERNFYLILKYLDSELVQGSRAKYAAYTSSLYLLFVNCEFVV